MIKTLLFDFSNDSSLSSWQIVDDGVMGGQSQGHFQLTADGHGLYSGQISLENNGGFSSLRYNVEDIGLNGEKEVVLRIKGDGKRYQCRLKSSNNEAHSYAHYFETSGAWETVRLSLSDFFPTFRGRKLNQPNYPAQKLAEFGILISNKKEETFELQIDWIGFD